MEANTELVRFIKEARKKGYADSEIRALLVKNKWSSQFINSAFAEVESSMKDKSKITIYLKDDLLSIIEKRAKKNIMTTPEQIEDIIRRSCINTKIKKQSSEKLDDLLVSIFSRKRTK